MFILIFLISAAILMLNFVDALKTFKKELRHNPWLAIFLVSIVILAYETGWWN